MSKILLTLTTVFFFTQIFAGTITGTVKDKNGTILSFASVLVKGSTKGVTANSKGGYSIQLPQGEYTLVCQYIGYQAQEKKVKVGKEDMGLDFQLESQQYDLKNVEVRSGGEDPAYAIIRKAIEKRTTHLNELKKFQCEVYIKGQMQLRNYPQKFLGQKIDFEDGDTSKRKMLFLSETIARYSVEEPRKQKIEVLSTKVSGRSNGFGLSSPQIISFYENIISVGNDLNPRGFISPISDNALRYYKYKFEGSFYENGVEISRIKVMPRRKYEPLFSGYINIVENEWRLQSVKLLLLKEQQLELLDTLKIEQLFVPANNVWVIKNQVIYPAGKFFGFDFFGSFVQVYDKFDLDPLFQKKFFDNTLIKFYDSSNKKPLAYWDSIRPLPLLPEEVRDYVKKDSLEQVRKDPRYLDSLDKKRNKIRLGGILFTGQYISNQKKKTYISLDPLLSTLNYNTVEGGVLNFSPTYTRTFKEEGRSALFLKPDIRYGFANSHWNLNLTGGYSFGKKYFQNISFSGGRKVFQYNNAEPISPRINSISTLQYEANYMKIYEANYFRVGYNTGVGNGFTANISFQFQDRYGLDNLADMTRWRDLKNREFTPNYPTELAAVNMPRNQSAVATLGITWRPGVKYMELPGRKIALGMNTPTFSVSLSKGIHGLLGSDVDYTKWQAGVSSDLDLKLGGRFQYRIGAGGFLQSDKVYMPDYIHFMGNQTVLASDYVTSFQLIPYYKYSNTEKFYATAHLQYHLNGLLSNKIPGFRKLNWHFVVGANALHLNNAGDYYETMFGIENILKIIRVDYVLGFEKGGGRPSGFRISVPLK